MDELISVIVPIYNSEKYLKRCIESIVKQKYDNIEIILINDGSTDNSLKIIEEFMKKDNRIVLINQENQGVSNSRNRGIEASKGKYIIFIDSDDYILEDYIDNLMSNANRNRLVVTNFSNIKSGCVSIKQYLKYIITGKIRGVCWGYLFEKEKIKNIRFDNNTSYMEDTIFLVNTILEYYNIVILKENLYFHEENSDSLTRSLSNINKKINGYLYSIEKIEDVLKSKKLYTAEYEKYLNNRKIKIVEAEISTTRTIDELEEIFNNPKIKQLSKNKKSFKYYVFQSLLERKNVKWMFRYIKLRKKIKNIIRGK